MPVLSPWTLKAILLVTAGAATMMIGLAITKHVSVEPDSPKVANSVADWHEAETFVPAEGPEPSSHTVMHNGLTVVSPELLVPVIDLAALEELTGSDGKASASKSSGRKRSRYAKRSRAHRQTHWKAYGLAIR
ncbi:MAG TPA: hypothetical protein VJ719_02145 [Chthoniobacterales bacterium]|nr:hypothetical protein [Chthoniobacterales bacterium]